MTVYADLLALLVDGEPIGAAILRPTGEICRANAGFADRARTWTVDSRSCRFLGRAARSASAIVGSILLTADDGASRKIACNARGLMIAGHGAHVLVRESLAQREFAEKSAHFRTLARELGEAGAELGTLRSVFDATPDAVMVLGTGRAILMANPAALAMFGGKLRAAEFARALDLQSPPGSGALDAASSGIIQMELAAWRSEGHFPIEVTARHARVSGEDVWITCIRDLSDRKGLERALQRAELLEEARDRAEQARLAKARFLATVSHELRTPLHGVNSALELALSRMPDAAADRRLIELAYRSCRAALDQVNRVLEISRIEGRELGDHPRRVFDLVATIEGVCSETRSIAERKAIGLDICLPTEPLLVDSFEHLVRQLVQNLVSNAIKFTVAGRVALSLAVEREGAGQAAGVLNVSDTGIGFDVADLARLKREFETGDASFCRIEDGAGLGLALVEQALQALGGTMEVRSTQGVGSCFTVRLPLTLAGQALAPEPEVDRPDQKEAEGLLVLLAEDNEINAEILKELLESLGAEVRVAQNGARAIAQAQAQAFDIILMDVSMPEVDGITATRAIRNRGENVEALIVGLTAHCDEEVLRACRDAGMDDVHTKPISMSRLRSILRGEISGGLVRPPSDARLPSGATGPAEATAPPPPSVSAGQADTRAALGPEKFEAYRTKLVGQLQDTLASLPGMLATAAFEQIADAAHKHVGALSFIGEVRLVEALRALERAARARSAGSCHLSVAALVELLERPAALG